MKKHFVLMSGWIFLVAASQVPAVTIYECVDDAGNKTYQDRCPPGTTPVTEKNIRTGPGSSTKTVGAGTQVPDVEILMYSAPECDACMILRGVLDEYKAPYTDKNINASDEVKRELQEKAGGSSTLTIPTVIVGESVIAGFKKSELVSALEQAGFKKPVVETEEEEEVEEPAAETAETPEPALETTEEETTTESTAPAGSLEVVQDEQGRQILRPVGQ
jgi:glutaredoxin